MILSCLPRYQYQRRLLLDYYKIALKHCNIGFGLLLNPSKSAIVYFGTHGRLRQSILPSQIIAAGCTIHVSDRLCLLGVTLDNTLSFDQHVNNIAKNCNYHLQALRHIRASVTDEVAKMMACSIIGSRIDYCNSLFYGMPDRNLNNLQRVQNRPARIVCVTRSQHTSSTQQLYHLHWLPVCSRIQFKLSILCFRSRTLKQPQYLSDTLHSYQPTRLLCSLTQDLLTVPRSKTVFGGRRFSVAAPRL